MLTSGRPSQPVTRRWTLLWLNCPETTLESWITWLHCMSCISTSTNTTTRSSQRWRRTPRPRRCSLATDCSRSQLLWRIKSLTCDIGNTHQSMSNRVHSAGWTEKQESSSQTNGKQHSLSLKEEGLDTWSEFKNKKTLCPLKIQKINVCQFGAG